MTPGPGQPIGVVVGGSLAEGLEVKLEPGASVEDIKVGTYVTIQGERNRFLCMVSDIRLEASDPSLRSNLPDVADPFIARVVAGTVAFGMINVRPYLVLPAVAGDPSGTIGPAKTIPGHFSGAHISSGSDLAAVFGREDDSHFHIGSPLDMEEKVCLDLGELVKRSNGVFGKSGTGKTFLTRLLLIGILQSNLASLLVFDMHNEYGWKGRDPERRIEVKGLKQLFPSRVAVFTLDEESSLRRGLTPDFVVRIGYSDIEPEDVMALRETLNLSPVAAESSFTLRSRLGKEWLGKFLGHPDLGELAREANLNEGALGALHRRLETLTSRFGFLVKEMAEDSVRRILENLDRGDSVVLEFGRYGEDLSAYIPVANMLTRRIREEYRKRSERALGEQAGAPRPLAIVIEEAHKFLGPEVSGQTVFGSIAREMRKYNVTLLVVDQRPSAIDPEVMSQIGTKVCCLLDNERDIDAVLAGQSGSRELRLVLSRLESRQQALIFGHAVPMPIAVRTREYGSAESYAQLTRRGGSRQSRDAGDELFG